jgi:hypothetical protein
MARRCDDDRELNEKLLLLFVYSLSHVREIFCFIFSIFVDEIYIDHETIRLSFHIRQV